MTGFAHGSTLISLIAVMFAALLIATPPLAVLTAPHDVPVKVPSVSSHVSAFA